MSRARHHAKHRAKGGGTKETEYNAQGSNAMKEAKETSEGSERKRGGGVHHLHGEGEKGKHRADKRARGGATLTKDIKHTSMKHMTPGRKRGGGIGANRTPLSTAATIKEVTKGEYGEDAEKNPRGEPKNP